MQRKNRKAVGPEVYPTTLNAQATNAMCEPQEERRDPPLVRKARLVTAYNAVKAARFDYPGGWHETDIVLTNLAAAIARIDLEG